MPYIIENSKGNAIIIPDGGLNQDYSIDLVGRNYENYGEKIAKTQIDLLDNFAHDVAPVRPTDGQLWFDSGDNLLRVYVASAQAWQPLTPIMRDTTAPANEYSQNREGTLYYNKDVGQLFIHTGAGGGFIRSNIPGEVSNDYSGNAAISNPSSYGTKLRNIYLTDTNGDPRAVLAVIYVNSSIVTNRSPAGETIIAIFSAHDEFTVDNTQSRSEGVDYNYYAQLTETGGVGTRILPGANYRSDNKTRVEVANVADRANTSYALNLGSYGADGANIDAANVFHTNKNITPNGNTYIVGNATNIYAEGYFGDLKIGGLQPQNYLTKYNSSTWVSIGVNGSAIDEAHIEDLYISGNLITSGQVNLGSSSSRINEIFANSINTLSLTVDGYTFPTSAGSSGQQLYIDGSGQLFWEEPASDIADISPGNGLSAFVSSNPNLGPGGEVTRRVVTVNVGQGNGIQVNPDDIEVDMSVFSTSDLAEGSRKYYTDERVDDRVSNLLQEGAGIDLTYDDTANTLTVASTITQYTDSDARGAVSHNDAGGDGSFSYNSTSGVFTYTGPNQTEANARIAAAPTQVRSHFSNGGGISITDGAIAVDTTVVRTSGAQTVGGAKTFSTGIVAPSIEKTAGAKLTLNSSSALFSANLEVSGKITASGDVIGFGTVSDINKKENINKIEHALEKVNSISGYTFNYKNDPTPMTGVIAQEIEKVLPEVVFDIEDENGETYKAVRNANIVGLLIEAIKELSAEIEDLKKGR